jgi:hypothetical protein
MSDIVKPPEAKESWVQSFVKRARGEIQSAPASTPISYVREAGTTLGDFAEGGITGSLLGATHGKWGLDSKAGPVDAWIAGLGAAGSVLLSGISPGLAAHARKVGSQAFTVLSFRKGYEVVKHEPLAGGTSSPSPGVQRIPAPGTGPGIAGEDTIVATAKNLDLG